MFSVIFMTFCTAGNGLMRKPNRIPELTILLKESNRMTRPVSPLISCSRAKYLRALFDGTSSKFIKIVSVAFENHEVKALSEAQTVLIKHNGS